MRVFSLLFNKCMNWNNKKQLFPNKIITFKTIITFSWNCRRHIIYFHWNLRKALLFFSSIIRATIHTWIFHTFLFILILQIKLTIKMRGEKRKSEKENLGPAPVAVKNQLNSNEDQKMYEIVFYMSSFLNINISDSWLVWPNANNTYKCVCWIFF